MKVVRVIAETNEGWRAKRAAMVRALKKRECILTLEMADLETSSHGTGINCIIPTKD